MTSLTAIFGPNAEGLSELEAARNSETKFVRSEAQLAVHDLHRRPTGHVLTAWEAYSAYGTELLEEAVEYGSAILRCSADATGTALKRRRENLDLSLEDVVKAASMGSVEKVKAAEMTPSNLSTDELMNLAFVLGLDERLLAFSRDSGGDRNLAYRLRQLSSGADLQSPQKISRHTVLHFAEAASIIRVQLRLQNWLGLNTGFDQFEPSDFYGSPQTPAWKAGYNLAEDARVKLKLGETPIQSMRELVEERLGIPVIQVEIDPKIAGATVETSDCNGNKVRGVVLNASGENENVWVRRATLAHELGHLLFDPNDRLRNACVDRYDQSQVDPQSEVADPVEQRANAFAIAFLAPLNQVREVASVPFSREKVVEVMHRFGLSQTAARYHICNAHYRQHDLSSFRINESPGDELKAAENFTTDFFPIPNTPIQRRGRFAELVVKAFSEGLISVHTASMYLRCAVDEFSSKVEALESTFG